MRSASIHPIRLSLPAGIVSSCAADVCSIVVPDGFVTEEPLTLTIGARTGHAAQMRVAVGRGARVTIHEDIASPGSARGDWSYAVDVMLAQEAQCRYVSLQRIGSGLHPTITQHSRVGEGAHMHWHNTTLGGSDVSHDLRSTVVGRDAVSSVDWIFYAKGSEKQRLSARNVFSAASGRGEITMRGVAEGKGYVACNGLIDIGLTGNGTDTYLTEEVLMLDPTAKVDAVPGLEIKTNDVKASHSATVARVTEEDLFYFAARGIGLREARRMYVEGFLSDLTGRVGDADTQERLSRAIRQKYARR